MILSLRRKLVSLNGEKKKGFTLVELLVVIAIIAILATVSTVGYLGFTKQAKISNDLTELTQYKTIITGLTLDDKGTSVVYEEAKTGETTTPAKSAVLTYSFTADASADNKGTLAFSATTKDGNISDLDGAKAATAIENLLGADWIDGGKVFVTLDTDKKVESIAYYHHYDADAVKSSGSVKWTIATDLVEKIA